jgi:hypothetical protein
MDYHLDRIIRYSTEREYENLYKWSLKEFDENGNQLGRDQIPWKGGLSFTATELNYLSTIVKHAPFHFSENNDEAETEDNEEDPAVFDDKILGYLQPGFPAEDNWDDETVYSMFGTERIVENFQLMIIRINPTLEGEGEKETKERVSVWGIPRNTVGIDFRDYTQEDVIQITVRLKPENFDPLVKRLQIGAIDQLYLNIEKVPGFYSEWSPEVSTNRVKVLAMGNNEEVVMPDGVDFQPPYLHGVNWAKGFSLSARTNSKLTLKPTPRLKDTDSLYPLNQFELDEYSESVLSVAADEEQRPDPNIQLIIQLAETKKAIASLKVPLWLAVILLGLIVLSLL